jgi:hypothetical protein
MLATFIYVLKNIQNFRPTLVRFRTKKSYSLKSRRTCWRELCQRFISNLPLWKVNRRITGCRNLCKFWRIPYELAKIMRVLNVARVRQTHTKWSAACSFNWQDAQTGLVVSPILFRCLLKEQCPVIRETRILSCFLGRLIKYLVVCYSGCLIQIAWIVYSC